LATWEDVKAYIRNKYKLQDDKDDFFSMVFDLSGDRTQIVFIKKASADGRVWVEINSPVGVIPQNKLDAALTMLDDKICGGLVKIGQKHFVRHSAPIDDLSAEELSVPLAAVTATADDLEKEFVGGDAQ